jgi:MFS family permease
MVLVPVAVKASIYVLLALGSIAQYHTWYRQRASSIFEVTEEALLEFSHYADATADEPEPKFIHDYVVYSCALGGGALVLMLAWFLRPAPPEAPGESEDSESDKNSARQGTPTQTPKPWSSNVTPRRGAAEDGAVTGGGWAPEEARSRSASPSPLLSEGEEIGEQSSIWVWTVTTMNLALGFMMASQGILLAPLDAKRIWPHHSSQALGAFIIMGGFAQLAGPEAGYWSDTFRSSIGRRRPMLICGVASVWTFTFALWIFSLWRWPFCYLFAAFCQQLSWTVVQATQAGLVPDLVQSKYHGVAGGCTASNLLTGALSAMVCVHFILQNLGHHDYHVFYGIQACLAVFLCAVVCMVARETSSLGYPQHDTNLSTLRRIYQNYTYDWRLYKDFTKLLITKTLYCLMAVVKFFLLFYCQDTFRTGAEAREIASNISIVTECTAAAGAIGAMLLLNRWSDGAPSEGSANTPRTQRTQRKSLALWILIGGAAVMAVMWAGPIFIGYQAEVAFDEHESEAKGREQALSWKPLLLTLTGIWGLGQGIYLTGDQALNYDLLPDINAASRYLGLNQVCIFFGFLGGGFTSSALLAILGDQVPEAPEAPKKMPKMGDKPEVPEEMPQKGYAYPGYFAIFAYAAFMSLCLVLVAWTINPVASKRRQSWLQQRRAGSKERRPSSQRARKDSDDTIRTASNEQRGRSATPTRETTDKKV